MYFNEVDWLMKNSEKYPCSVGNGSHFKVRVLFSIYAKMVHLVGFLWSRANMTICYHSVGVTHSPLPVTPPSPKEIAENNIIS